jgi:hypothetical protein
MAAAAVSQKQAFLLGTGSQRIHFINPWFAKSFPGFYYRIMTFQVFR